MISIILPTYNEERNIVPLIKMIQDEMRERNYEILVVDDGSSDKTVRVVEEAFDSRVRIYRRKAAARSLGASVGEGIRRSQEKYVLVMDTDGNHQPHYLPFMIEALQNYDVVSASRFMKGGGMTPSFRYWTSLVFNQFLQRIMRSRIKDQLNGFFAARADVIRTSPYCQIFFGHGDYCFRMLHWLEQKGCSMLEFPVQNAPRMSGVPSRRLWHVFFQYIKSVIIFQRSLKESRHGS